VWGLGYRDWAGLWVSSLVSPHAEAWGYSNSLTLNPSSSGRGELYIYPDPSSQEGKFWVHAEP